ncbi:restriction endonuclease [Phascolarctobacterium succinatutens]|uniref:restriction endonuclease n=1 Tax=Phascolarctobacterium succinatutens TaxID=626940 RepID=UPI003FD74EA1
MYWLLDYAEQENLRQRMVHLQSTIMNRQARDQSEQIFPFIGRKSRAIARTLIENLTDENAVIVDPFGGSGTFAYAALDAGRHMIFNEWEPYAYEMSTAPFRGVPSPDEYADALCFIAQRVEPTMNTIYKTRCPNCGAELVFDGLFFDREPLEYYHPTQHERLGENGENVIFRDRRYRCQCGCKEKHYDDFDEAVRLRVESMPCNFPNVALIENSRLNFTAPQYTAYQNLFSKRQQIALMTLKNAIAELPEGTRTFFEDTLISIAHCGKYTDYRSKSQDNHCPENRLKETNLYHRFLEKLKERKEYIAAQNFDLNQLEVNSMDYRRFLRTIPPNTVNLLLTDPPYGDNAQYFEHAQRVHPLMNYSLSADNDRLHNEVVISNAPSRTDKHGKEQFLVDIERLFIEANRIVDDHGFIVLYFRPQQRDWVSDLNKLKDFGRRHGFEPLLTISAGIADPSMRALASAAWTFKNDVCFIFLKLQECERRWYEGEVDIDELVFLAATSAATDQGNPFVITRFNQEFQSQLRRTGLMRLAHPMYEDKIRRTLDRFTTRNGAQYRLTRLSPYTLMNREMNAEIRLREFAPVVIEELTANGEGFTFEEYVIHLASYMENGSREIINQLHTANRLIPELLNVYAVEDPERGKFFARTTVNTKRDVNGREHLCAMDPADFERLIADYFLRRGFVRAEVIGHSGDRGVDVLATNTQGELELIQCKRYRSGNNIGSTPIQRVDSYMRSRHASRAWVITTSDFTPDGRDEARITNVIIMNGQDLLQSLELYYPGRFCL